MNYVDIKELGIHSKGPAVTIYLSCEFEKRSVEKLNHLFGKAMAQLKEQFPQEAPDVKLDVHFIQSQIDFSQKYLKSVAIFVNKHIARVYGLPFALPDTISLDATFLLAPLIYALNRHDRFWLLLLHKTPHLFCGYEDALVEVVHKHRTREGEKAYDIQDAAGEICTIPVDQWGARCRYKTSEEFIAALDGYLEHFIDDERLPLLVTGAPDQVDLFKQHSRYAPEAHVLKQSALLLPELLKQALPVVHKLYAEHRKADLKAVKDACKAKMCAQGAEAVFKAAHQDRIKVLVVERTLKVPGCEDQARADAHKATHCGSLKPIDLVDEIIRVCRSKGVEVSLFEHGELEEFDGIAAALTD